MATPLSGVLTALATPFDSSGEIDAGLLARVVDRSVSAGVGGVVAGGSTGEFAALDHDERLRLVELVTEQTAGRVPVVAQTGATSTREAIRLSRAAERAGADVLMLVTPYYEPLSVAETVAYLKDVCAAVDLPVMLYNIPTATGVALDLETVAALAEEVDTIRHVKDSSANWELGLQLIHHLGPRVGTFIGWDAYAYSALTEGATGVLAGTANVVPGHLVALHRAVRDGDHDRALRIWGGLYPAIDAMLSQPFVAAVKDGLRLTGLDVGVPRHPVAPLGAGASAIVQRALEHLPPAAPTVVT